MIPAAQIPTQFRNDPYVSTYFTTYAIALGAIGGGIGTLVGLAQLVGKKPSDQILTHVAIFLMLWWTAGVIVVTFFNPFVSVANNGLYGSNVGVSNGYFGSWFAFMAAVKAVRASGLKMSEISHLDRLSEAQMPAFYLFLSSSVVMGAAIGPCSPSSSCTNYNAFAIALGVVSQFLSLFICFGGGKSPQQTIKYTALFLGLWWVVGTGVVTFGAPFTSAGNGYFASFASVFLSFVVIKVQMNQE